MKDLTMVIIGVFIGVFLSITIYCIDIPKKQDISLNAPPSELPANIECIITQPNLKEVVL